MYRHITNLLAGQVTGRVESGFPERVLNICAEHGLRFWDLEWESAVAFTFTMTRRDWRRLRRLSRRLDCQLEATSWRGAPFFVGRLRFRFGLWITLGLCLAALLAGSFFIWDFDIEGNETVTDLEILRALEKHGVTFGSFGLGVNSFELRNDILLDLPQLSYIAVNVKGSRAYVQVRERIPVPEIISKRQPGNTVAEKDALITDIRVFDGEKLVLPGTTVKQGQLLISGVVENDYAGARYLRGMGEVWGRTWYSLTCQLPLTTAEKVYTGEERTRRALILGKNRLDLYFGSSISGDTCDKIISYRQCTLPGGVLLPVTVVTEQLRDYTLRAVQRTEREALALAEELLLERLEGYLDGGEVLKTELRREQVGDTLRVTLLAECREEIGKFVEIPVEIPKE